jgi:hypothetical protein
MKQKTRLLSAALFIALGAANANQVQIENISQGSTPLTLVYQIARQNPGHAVHLEDPQTLSVTHAQAVSFGLDHYNLAGIVVLSVNGRVLPSQVARFGGGCYGATDSTYTAATLKIRYLERPGNHGEIYCEHSGEVILK